MKIVLLNIIMSVSIYIAAIIIFIVWVYILIENLKIIKEQKSSSGEESLKMFNLKRIFQFITTQRNDAAFNSNFQKHKELSKKHFKTWITTIIIITILLIFIGIITADVK